MPGRVGWAWHNERRYRRVIATKLLAGELRPRQRIVTLVKKIDAQIDASADESWRQWIGDQAELANTREARRLEE
jgi:hypothetical protein